MVRDEIIEELFNMQDKEYGKFQAKLIPNVDEDCIIGVRTPMLRKYAKKLIKRDDIDEFLDILPHKYFDEYQLHAFIISEIKDFDKCIERINSFLPYVDNWATCDQLSPKFFKKNRLALLKYIEKWLVSDKVYTVRFAIGMLMSHFLDDLFDVKYPNMVAKIRSDEYYINMMIAWYFATGLAKQYEVVLPFITGHKLDKWTHNKTIQKCVESSRISKEQKEELKTMKIK